MRSSVSLRSKCAFFSAANRHLSRIQFRPTVTGNITLKSALNEAGHEIIEANDVDWAEGLKTYRMKSALHGLSAVGPRLWRF